MIAFDDGLDAREIVQDPYAWFDAQRTAATVAWSERLDGWAVLGHSAARQAFRHQSLGQGDRTFGYVRNLPAADQRALHPMCEHMPRFISHLDPPEHTAQRGMAGKAFHPRVIHELAPTIAGRASELLDSLEPRERFDVIDDYALPLASTILSGVLGVSADDRDQFIAWVETIFTFLGSDHRDVDTARAAKVAYAAVVDYLQGVLGQRRQGSPIDEGDLVGRFLLLEQAGAATESDILGVLVGLMQGGFETTMTTISNSIFTLLRHHDELARLRADWDLLPLAVEEVVRFESPLKYLVRRASTDLQLADRSIRAGEHVFVFLGSANRDAQAFDNPHRFDVARQPNPHLGFGSGMHFCLGAPLARLQASIALRSILERFPRLELDGSPAQMADQLIAPAPRTSSRRDRARGFQSINLATPGEWWPDYRSR